MIKKTTGLLLMAVIVSLLISGCSKGNKPPGNYFSKEEDVSSITEIVGERSLEDSSEKADKKESGKNEKTSDKDKKSADKEEKDTKAEDTEEKKTAKEEDPNNALYTYVKVENPAADVDSYLKYLTDTKKFVNITPADKTGEDPHYEFAMDSVKKGSLLKLTIDQKKDSYTIQLTSSKGTLSDIQQQMKTSDTKKNTSPDSEGLSWSQAIDKVKTLTPSELGISELTENDSINYENGRITIDGVDFFDIRIYEKKENGSRVIKGMYRVSCQDGNIIYKYNLDDDTYTLVKKSQITDTASTVPT